MRILALFVLTAFSLLPPVVFADGALPNQPAMAKKNANGVRVMDGWSLSPNALAGMKDRQTPDHPAFEGAELFHFSVDDKSADMATVTAFAKAGMQRPKIVAKTALMPAAIDILDSHPDAEGYAVMVEGAIDGQPAYGISISLFGSLTGGNRNTGVHAFMAPKDRFEALGGFSIVVAQWFFASAKPGENMRIEGGLAPQAATNRAALFFNKWVEGYVIPMMGLTMQAHMKSLEMMSSWNSAAATCAGDSSCTVTQDSLGNWSATFDQ